MIETKDLSFAYPGEHGATLALDDVTLQLEAGKFIAVLGHNGSGKSTLAGHFNAIHLPTFGKCYVQGMDTLNPENTYEIRKHVSMVFQNPDNQIVATVVEEDVAFALENLGIEPQEIRRRVDEALKAVDMYDYRTHAPHMLSGGQKQRVAIAGVLAVRPQCIVLDEPTAMLDPQGRHEVMQVVKTLSSQYGITVVLITHHMDEAALADRIIVMHGGKVYIDGTPRTIFTQVEKLKQARLDVPQTVEVLYQINQQTGTHLPIDALSVDECVSRLADYLTH